MLTWKPTSDPLKPMQCLAQFDGKVIDGSSIEGFRQYSDYSKDRRTILEPSWFDRVVRGLKAISPLTCVAMRNTWNDIYHGDAIDNLYEEIVTCPGPASSPYGSERVRSESLFLSTKRLRALLRSRLDIEGVDCHSKK